MALDSDPVEEEDAEALVEIEESDLVGDFFSESSEFSSRKKSPKNLQ